MQSTAAPTDPIETVNVLVVDDHADNRAALRALLSDPGYRIVEADSGPEALRHLLHEDFAVLLLDVMMPGMSGFELARLVKQRPRAASVPILFLTAVATDVSAMYEGYDVGAVDYLVKPLVPEMVRAKVAVFAELHRQRKRLEIQGQRLLQSERRESELRLLELRLANERRFRNLTDAMPQIVWTARPDGTIDYFNQRWFEATGVTLERAAGTFHEALHHDDVERAESLWRSSLSTGLPFEVECRLRAPTGSHRWYLCRATPEHGSDGKIVAWLGTFTDVDEQKRARAELEQFQATLDAVVDAVLIFDPSALRVSYANEGASALLGYARDDLTTMHAADVMSAFDEHHLRELIASLVGVERHSRTLETQWRRSDARMLPVEVSYQYVLVEGGGRIVAVARDITERKQAEIERELLYRQVVDALRERDEFLSLASHELRTPLTALKLNVQSLLRPSSEGQALAADAANRLQLVARQVDRLGHLVDELLDVSRIRTGRLELAIEEADLASIVRDVVKVMADDAARAGSVVTCVAESPVIGQWDGSRLEQVVTNLLSNAIKYGGGKPIDVLVEKHGSGARLTIRDHGIGIAVEDRERIFERFERAVSLQRYAGLGLGLYITHTIVAAHGGTIRVESDPGLGSTFVVELPEEPPAAGAEARLVEADAGPTRS